MVWQRIKSWWKDRESDEAARADMRAWILRDRMKHVRPEDAVRVLSNDDVAASYARHLRVSVEDLLAHAKTLAIVIKGSMPDSLRIEGVPATSVSDVQIVDGSLRVQPAVAQAPVVRTMQVTTTPVMEVRRVLNDEAVRMCREAGRDELVEYAWLARFEHEGTRHDQCSSGPLKAIRNSSHEMLRCKVLPEHGPRVVLVQMVKDGEVVYAFELDVAKPAWMVTARQHIEDAVG